MWHYLENVWLYFGQYSLWIPRCDEIKYDVIDNDVISSIPRVNNQLWLDLPIQILVLIMEHIIFKQNYFRSKFSVGYLISHRQIPYRASSRADLILEVIPNRAITVSFLGLENVRQLIIIIGQFRQNQIIIFQRGDEVFMENHNL